jgi:hypothetical protein
MGIHQQAAISFDVWGDNVSTVQQVDLTKQIEAAYGSGAPFSNKPLDQMVVLIQPVLTILSPSSTINGTAEVIGNVLVVTWASAPPPKNPATSPNTATITLGY